MDYVTRQFIVLVKKFRKEARKALELFHRDIQNHTEAVRAQNTRSEKERELQPIWLDKVISQYQQSERSKSSQEDRHYRIQNSIRWATWGAFIAASIYGSVAMLQWSAAREASYEYQRPWVTGNAWEFPFKFLSDKDPCADQLCVGIYIRNSGNSPALNVTGGGLISTSDPNPTAQPRNQQRIRGVLPGNDSATWFVERVTPDQAAEYAKGKRLYVQARIEYCDIWNNFNWTNFCIYHESSKPDREFWPCPGVNDSVETIPHGCRKFRKAVEILEK
jgi:hypothetical protein